MDWLMARSSQTELHHRMPDQGMLANSADRSPGDSCREDRYVNARCRLNSRFYPIRRVRPSAPSLSRAQQTDMPKICASVVDREKPLDDGFKFLINNFAGLDA